MERITSRHNPLVRRFRDLARPGRRGEHVLLEGSHLIEEALASGVPLEAMAFTEAFEQEAADLIERAGRAGARLARVPPQVLEAMSPVKRPSGTVAIGRAGPTAPGDLIARARGLVLLVHGVQDPGNVGAIVRTAEACGAGGLIAAPGTADPFGWKALRGSMGSAFRLPIAAADAASAIRAARGEGLHVIATVPRGGTPLHVTDLRRPCAVVLGGEGPGLDPEVLALVDGRLTIPMRAPVESLNVAVAAGLILYEASRQRNRSGTEAT